MVKSRRSGREIRVDAMIGNLKLNFFSMTSCISIFSDGGDLRAVCGLKLIISTKRANRLEQKIKCLPEHYKTV